MAPEDLGQNRSNFPLKTGDKFSQLSWDEIAQHVL